MPFIAGGALAVGAALLIYLDATGLTDESLRWPVLASWVVLCGVVALIGALRNKKD